MTKNPFLNALASIGYIVLVSSLMFYGFRSVPGPDTVLAPIMALSLLSFSAATMGFLFLYQPFVMYFNNQKKQAIKLFLQTLLYFGAIIFLLLLKLLFLHK